MYRDLQPEGAMEVKIECFSVRLIIDGIFFGFDLRVFDLVHSAFV